jgi:hypothetical protein
MRGVVANVFATKTKVPMRKLRWERPTAGFDARYHVDDDAAAKTALLRDSSGAFIAGCCSYKQHAMDASSMEAYALLDGLRLADKLGILAVLVESDSMEIVQAILDPSDYRASASVVMDDYLKMMSSFGR